MENFRNSFNNSGRQSNNTGLTNNVGLTLVELIAVLAIIAITLGLGIPSLQKWQANSTQSLAFKNLYHLTFYARALAIKENSFVTLCASDDNLHCTGEWNRRLIVFRDDNKNERVDDGEHLLKVHEFPDSTPCLELKVSLGRQYLQFKPTGQVNGTAGHFRTCDDNTKKMVISFTGRTAYKS